MTKQEMNLLVSVALDRVLGEEAPVVRANMLRQVIQEVDRKGSKMNYSKALNECIESAYMVAGHFGARYLESWHLLIAMSNHSYSVAGATLNDYPYEMDRLEEVALELTETDYSQDETFTELPFSHRLQVLF